MNNLYIINHPLIQSKVTMLRLKETETGSKAFRELVSEIAALICYEATKNLELTKIEVDSIFGKTEGKILEKKVSIVPILRAGIGMVDGILSLIPTANVGHIGLYRDPKTLKPIEYFCKLPVNVENSEILLIDPMLATGGTAIMAIDALKAKGCKNIKFLCLISCPEGVKALHSSHPDVDIYTAALDEKLNEHGYIIPGLGDAGDRMFGTK